MRIVQVNSNMFPAFFITLRFSKETKLTRLSSIQMALPVEKCNNNKNNFLTRLFKEFKYVTGCGWKWLKL